ncbi:MAG: hypothetical protein J7L53_09450 [Deltaproteobacteria bacterium]|nr:hypothetical protein [Deltaproteobacteria bacterium]
MASRNQNTFRKKAREEAKRKKRVAKEARRQERKELKANQEPRMDMEDPDIEGIVPGPQPRPEEWDE